MLHLRNQLDQDHRWSSRLFFRIYDLYLSLFNPDGRERRIAKRRRKAAERRYPVVQALADDFLKSFPVVKLNLGCGDVLLEGWINVDRREDVPGIDVNYDLSRPFPFRDSTVDFIYNEHFLEHLTPEEGVRFLRECRRCLKPGGVARIAMPHIKSVINHYFNDDFKSDQARRDGIQTKAEMVNIGFKHWGHQWLYDETELYRRLREAGFEQIELRAFNESPHPELRNLETRIWTKLICEATK